MSKKSENAARNRAAKLQRAGEELQAARDAGDVTRLVVLAACGNKYMRHAVGDFRLHQNELEAVHAIRTWLSKLPPDEAALSRARLLRGDMTMEEVCHSLESMAYAKQIKLFLAAATDLARREGRITDREYAEIKALDDSPTS